MAKCAIAAINELKVICTDIKYERGREREIGTETERNREKERKTDIKKEYIDMLEREKKSKKEGIKRERETVREYTVRMGRVTQAITRDCRPHRCRTKLPAKMAGTVTKSNRPPNSQ